MRLLPALFIFLFSLSLSGQFDAREQAITEFVRAYNDQRAVRDWAATETTDVSFSVGGQHALVAMLNGGKVRVDLDRTAPDAMDGLFPLRLEKATVVYTNATILFFDASGEHHIGFSLLDEPLLPVLGEEYLTLFVGDGIGKRSALE